MIANLILNLFFAFVYGIVSILPNFSGLPSPINDALVKFSSAMNGLNNLLPIDTLLTILSITLTLEGSILTYKIVNWIINKVRGSG